MSLTVDPSLPSPGEPFETSRPVPVAVVPTEPNRDFARLPDRLIPAWVVEPRSYRWTWLGVALLVLIAYAAFTFRFWDAADDGVDQNAYLVGGRLLAEHGTMKYVLPNPYAYSGAMFVRMPDGVYFPKYPLGLPLLYALFFWGFKIASVLPWLKWHVDPNQAGYWAFLVSPLSAIAAVAGTFFIARRLAGSFPAVLAAILLGTSQLMISLSNNANSHEACTAFTVWGMYALICWQQAGGWWKGVLGGLLIGFAATIRYSEFLLVIPVGLACLSRMRWSRWKTYAGSMIVVGFVLGGYFVTKWHSGGTSTFTQRYINVAAACLLLLTAFLCTGAAAINFNRDDWASLLRNITPGLAWAVPVGGMLVFNLITMHTLTGYDPTNESSSGSAFAWKFFYQHWEKVIRSLYDLDAFFVLPVGLLGIIMLFRRGWPIGLTLLGWFLPGVVLYMFYYWALDFDVAFARFFLTFIPAIAIGAAVCIGEGVLGSVRTFRQNDKPWLVIAIAAVVIVACGYSTYLGMRGKWFAVPLLLSVPVIAIVTAISIAKPVFKADCRSSGWGPIPLTLAAAALVAVAASVNLYRSIHGLRDGRYQVAMLTDQYVDRLNYAHTGQVLLKNVPAGSVLFADDTGVITRPTNYIQFLNNWEVYGNAMFSADGLKRIAMLGGGGRRGKSDDADDAMKANPLQKEQQEYLVELYRDSRHDVPGKARGSTQIPLSELQKRQAQLIDSAFARGHRVFVCVGSNYLVDHSEMNGKTTWMPFAKRSEIHPADSFEQNLKQQGNYQFHRIDRWEDTSMPPDKVPPIEDDDPFGQNARNGVVKMFMNSGQQRIWELVEILPANPVKK